MQIVWGSCESIKIVLCKGSRRFVITKATEALAQHSEICLPLYHNCVAWLCQWVRSSPRVCDQICINRTPSFVTGATLSKPSEQNYKSRNNGLNFSNFLSTISYRASNKMPRVHFPQRRQGKSTENNREAEFMDWGIVGDAMVIHTIPLC